MGFSSIRSFIADLQRLHFLEAGQDAEIDRDLSSNFTQADHFGQELVKRGWLTPYQLDLLLQGRANDLLLNCYVFLDCLGEGGMGTVYKAKNWKLGRTVALKVIRKELLNSASAIRRFQREIRTAARLNHPNIVYALDADEADGRFFFVMEFIEGVDLANLVKQRGPLAVRDACEYVLQTALGLQHAHENGLVHRDIKPSNIILATREVNHPVVKILDFGLAWVHHRVEDESSALTKTGAVMGTPDYIAPEQARRSHDVDIRSDIYSLGCTFYYLLTGLPPFPGGTLGEKLVKHQLDEPEPLERLRTDVPKGLTAVIRKMMAKRPEDRFQKPDEVVAALRAGIDLGLWHIQDFEGFMDHPAAVEEDASPEAGWIEIASLKGKLHRREKKLGELAQEIRQLKKESLRFKDLVEKNLRFWVRIAATITFLLLIAALILIMLMLKRYAETQSHPTNRGSPGDCLTVEAEGYWG